METTVSIIMATVVVAVLIYFIFAKKEEGIDWAYATYFSTVFIAGTILYSIGLSYENGLGDINESVTIIVKSIGLTSRSFLGDFNLASVSLLTGDNLAFAIAISLNSVLALMLTALIAVKLFGKNIINRLHVLWNRYFRKKYIVIGWGEQAETFLLGLDRDKRRRTTVILEAKHKDRKNDLMFKGFAVVVIKDNKDGLKKNIATDDREYAETEDALLSAGFADNRKDTKIIAMSEDDKINIFVAKMVKDHIKKVANVEKREGRTLSLIDRQQDSLYSTMLWAYIMYEFLDRTEHFAFAEYALGRVRFFNPHEVSARMFIWEHPMTSMIPKSWININKARLYNSFENNLGRAYNIGNFFIGYGHTNQQILKKSICSNQFLGTDYNALVIDKDAYEMKKVFENSAPGLFNVSKNGRTLSGMQLRHDGTTYYPDPEEGYNIEFSEHNVLHSDFYKKIVNEISEGKNGDGYDFVSIVIALGDDKQSIETAFEIRQKLYEAGLLKGRIGEDEYDRVRIFVRVIEKSVLSDNDLLNDENDIDSMITIFGASNAVLTERYIIDEELDEVAKWVANEYWESADSHTNIVTRWDSLTDFKRDSNRYAAMSIKTKLNLLGFRLTEDEGRTNEGKIEKQYADAYGLATAVRQAEEKKDRKGILVEFVERDEKNGILDSARNNLAKIEHQRWNAFSLVNGWTKLPRTKVTDAIRQDERSKQHACITNYDGLAQLRKDQSEHATKNAMEYEKKIERYRGESGYSSEQWNALKDAEVRDIVRKLISAELSGRQVDNELKKTLKYNTRLKEYREISGLDLEEWDLLQNDKKEEIIKNRAAVEADTMNYDFDIMDRLLEGLKTSKKYWLEKL